MNDRLILAIGLLLAAFSQPGFAEDEADLHPYLTATYFVDLGVFFPQRKVELNVDGPVSSARDDIDFESEFGLKKSDDLLSLNFGWKFGEKWRLGGQYFESDGQRERALQEDVEWGEYVFGAGTGVRAGIEFSLFRTVFERNFANAEHHDFGLGVGLHWLEIGAFIEGNAILNGQQAGFRRESVKAEAPLPNIGAWYVRSLSEKWALQMRFDWLSADVGDYDGTLINAKAGINYRLFEHVGLGVSYNLFRLDIGVEKSGWRGDITTSYEGAFFHVTAYW